MPIRASTIYIVHDVWIIKWGLNDNLLQVSVYPAFLIHPRPANQRNSRINLGARGGSVVFMFKNSDLRFFGAGNCGLRPDPVSSRPVYGLLSGRPSRPSGWARGRRTCLSPGRAVARPLSTSTPGSSPVRCHWPPAGTSSTGGRGAGLPGEAGRHQART